MPKMTTKRAPAAARGPMAIEEVELDSLVSHELNLRHELGDLTELTDSIRNFGLIEPLVVAPDLTVEVGERLMLVAGHRRKAAALAAGLSTAPAIVRRDLDTAGLQVMAMLIENGRRADLSPVEEGQGYQLLLEMDDAYTPAKIGKAVGVKTERVKGRVAIAKLPEAARDRVHSGQITLKEAAVLAEFADDERAFKELLNSAGSYNFTYSEQRIRNERERAVRMRALEAELEKAGHKVIKRPAQYSWGSVEQPIETFRDPTYQEPEPEPEAAEGEEAGEDEDPDSEEGLASSEVEGDPRAFTAESHRAQCQYHAAIVDSYRVEAEYCCTDPKSAGHTPLYERESAQDRMQRAAEQRADDERGELLKAAAKARRQFVVQLPIKGELAVELLRHSIWESVETQLLNGELEGAQALGQLLNVEVPEEFNDDDEDAFREACAQALERIHNLNELVGTLWAMQMLAADTGGEFPYRWRQPRFLSYVRKLISLGYRPSPPEEEILASIERQEEAARQALLERQRQEAELAEKEAEAKPAAV